MGYKSSGTSLCIGVSRPLRRGVKINLDEPMFGSWIPIRYERLPDNCSFCGVIGHISRDCGYFYKFTRASSSAPQYGEWLRYGGRGEMIARSQAKDLRLESIVPLSPVNPLLSQSSVAMDTSTSNDSPLLMPRGFSRSGWSLPKRRKSFFGYQPTNILSSFWWPVFSPTRRKDLSLVSSMQQWKPKLTGVVIGASRPLPSLVGEGNVNGAINAVVVEELEQE